MFGFDNLDFFGNTHKFKKYDSVITEGGAEAVILSCQKNVIAGGSAALYEIGIMSTGHVVKWVHSKELKKNGWKSGEYYYNQWKKRHKEYVDQQTDLTHILTKLQTENLSSYSIFKVFEVLGYRSKFFDTGEYYVLYAEWTRLLPLIVKMRDSQTLAQVHSICSADMFDTMEIDSAFLKFKQALKFTSYHEVEKKTEISHTPQRSPNYPEIRI
jgi:hypothetical protein